MPAFRRQPQYRRFGAREQQPRHRHHPGKMILLIQQKHLSNVVRIALELPQAADRFGHNGLRRQTEKISRHAAGGGVG